jgi:hypothetical protein
MKNKIGLFLGKIVLFALPIFILFEVLFRMGYYPIITNSSFFDHKIGKAGRQRVKNLTLLAVGSSVAAYQLNSKIILDSLHIRYYNFSSWGMQIADTREVLQAFVASYHPKYILLCSSIADFTKPKNETYSNYTHTNPYIRAAFPEFFYFSNFSPIHQIAYRKSHAFHIEPDAWGGIELTIGKKDILLDKWNEHDIFPTGYTEGAYKELDSLGAFLKEKNITFIFVQAPLKASYTNTLTRKQIIDAHFDRCRSIVGAQGGIYLNYYNPGIFTDSLFFDQYHLQASGAAIYTREIVADLKKIIP